MKNIIKMSIILIVCFFTGVYSVKSSGIIYNTEKKKGQPMLFGICRAKSRNSFGTFLKNKRCLQNRLLHYKKYFLSDYS